jgi:NAD(P)-dependent dehydrogenase (short-subunit alcohol dehydrogenase family)
MRSVVITGTSSGIGQAAAALLVKNGFHVYAGVRTDADAARIWGALGAGVTPLRLDVTDASAIAHAAARVRADLGNTTLAGLVNNAAIAVTGPLLAVSPADLRRQMEVNLVGPLMLTQAFAPLLGVEREREGPRGRIVNMSSAVGVIAVPFLGPYVVSKHGMEGLSATLRRELMLYGIDVVTVAPGLVETPLVDKTLRDATVPAPGTDFEQAYRRYERDAAAMRAMATPREVVAAVIVKALTTRRPRARYAIVSGRIQNWILPRLLPARLIDRYIGWRLGLRA